MKNHLVKLSNYFRSKGLTQYSLEVNKIANPNLSGLDLGAPPPREDMPKSRIDTTVADQQYVRFALRMAGKLRLGEPGGSAKQIYEWVLRPSYEDLVQGRVIDDEGYPKLVGRKEVYKDIDERNDLDAAKDDAENYAKSYIFGKEITQSEYQKEMELNPDMVSMVQADEPIRNPEGANKYYKHKLFMPRFRKGKVIGYKVINPETKKWISVNPEDQGYNKLIKSPGAVDMSYESSVYRKRDSAKKPYRDGELNLSAKEFYGGLGVKLEPKKYNSSGKDGQSFYFTYKFETGEFPRLTKTDIVKTLKEEILSRWNALITSIESADPEATTSFDDPIGEFKSGVRSRIQTGRYVEVTAQRVDEAGGPVGIKYTVEIILNVTVGRPAAVSAAADAAIARHLANMAAAEAAKSSAKRRKKAPPNARPRATQRSAPSGILKKWDYAAVNIPSYLNCEAPLESAHGGTPQIGSPTVGEKASSLGAKPMLDLIDDILTAAEDEDWCHEGDDGFEFFLEERHASDVNRLYNFSKKLDKEIGLSRDCKDERDWLRPVCSVGNP